MTRSAGSTRRLKPRIGEAMEQGTEMAMAPDLDARLLGEMAPGELVRFRFRGKMILGMVAGCDFLQIPSGMVIMVLEDLPDRPGTAGGFLPMVKFLMAEPALSYGRKHIVIVHPAAPVASKSDARFNTNGALLIGGGARTVRSRSVKDDISDFVLNIDIDHWTVVRNSHPHVRPRRVAVLAWELRLLADVPLVPPLAPVFTFAAGG